MPRIRRDRGGTAGQARDTSPCSPCRGKLPVDRPFHRRRFLCSQVSRRHAIRGGGAFARAISLSRVLLAPFTWRPGGDLITAVGDVDARAAEERTLTCRRREGLTGAAAEVVSGAPFSMSAPSPPRMCSPGLTVSSLTPPTFTVAALAAPLSVRAREVSAAVVGECPHPRRLERVPTDAAVQDVGAEPAAQGVRRAITGHLLAAVPPVMSSMFLIASSLTPPTFTVTLMAAFSLTTTEVLLSPQSAVSTPEPPFRMSAPARPSSTIRAGAA